MIPNFLNLAKKFKKKNKIEGYESAVENGLPHNP